MDWESMPAEDWEGLTEEQWDAMVVAEKEREAVSEESADEAMLVEEEEQKAVADAEPMIDDDEVLPPPPPEAPPVELWSLRAAQVLAVNVGGPVRVPSASVLARKPGWVIPGLDKLAALARLDLLLTHGIDAHLFDNKHNVAYLQDCREWTWELQTAATEFGGRFRECKPVKRTCQKLRKVIAGALSHRRADEWLLENLATVLAELKATIAFFEV